MEGTLEDGAVRRKVSASNLKSLPASIQEAIEQVRNVYTQLVPTVLDDLGILATLKWFCRDTSHTDISMNTRSQRN